MANDTTKKCFVIAPIGEKGSDVRDWSDKTLRHIIKPATDECGYETQRADEISKPGIINNQIIDRLINDELVIADLSFHNPNVFYELAIRHAARKPIIQLIRSRDPIPFDVVPQRTIHYDLTDPDALQESRGELIKQIKESEAYPNQQDTPLSSAIDLKLMRESGDPVKESHAEIITILKEIKRDINDQRSLERLYVVPSVYSGEYNPAISHTYPVSAGYPDWRWNTSSTSTGIPLRNENKLKLSSRKEQRENDDE